ncbi:DgyrCDS6212 [Dimorphilus gyrociliatus]|uniref:DgyrCDS6212 n=1 Tax=Dimorphilus gyrociliatus TaxID=2664684 RepID=A0A7I8VMD3_9ANNE|nr:DgyrCDS6212 [Dimorphilus gyrociliatus]
MENRRFQSREISHVNKAFEANVDEITIDQINASVDEKKELDKENDERIFEDEEETSTPNCFSKFVMKVQRLTKEFLKSNKRLIKIVLALIITIAYLCYFGYAMYYELGSEESIRLLWMTCVVVVFVIGWGIYRFWKEPIDIFTDECSERLGKHSEKLSWLIGIIIYSFWIVFVIIDVAIVSKEPYNLVSACGIVVFIFLSYVFSKYPSRVKWRPVLWGLALQGIFAIFILRWERGFNAFHWMGKRTSEFLEHTDAGSKFVFGDNYADHLFAFKLIPVIVFFCAITSILFHIGVMQVVIKAIAKVLQLAMGTTAGESLNAAANIFIGQTEAPLVIKPLLPNMTKSELHAVMSGGFATIAGTVLAAYIGFGVPANHLISASIMSAPAALAISKLMYPETKKSKTRVEDLKEALGKGDANNIIDAASKGATASIALIANIVVNLIAFIAILKFFNSALTWFGRRAGVTEEDITFQFICSYLFYPIAILMGVKPEDSRVVASLIGTKTFINEFVAYQEMTPYIKNLNTYNNLTSQFNTTMEKNGKDIILYFQGGNATLPGGLLAPRSIVIATYALCGFANVGSMGVMIGAMKVLVPSRQKVFSELVVRALVAGTIACFLTACIAGLLFDEKRVYGVRIKDAEIEERIEMDDIAGKAKNGRASANESNESDGEREEREIFRRRSSRKMSVKKLKRRKSGFEYQDDEPNNAFVRIIEISQTKLMMFYLKNKQTIFLAVPNFMEKVLILAVIYCSWLIFVLRDIIRSKEYYNLISGAGILFFVLISYIFSYNPVKVNWRPVLWGIALQAIFAVLILRTSAGYKTIEWIAGKIQAFIDNTNAGSKFVFGDLYYNHLIAFKVMPVIVFFSTCISILYYLGILQIGIKAVAYVMQKTMGTTTGESLTAAANIFIGQTEVPLIIKPLLEHMTRSELHSVMTGGFATIAGSVMGAYITFGVPANHLLSASVMSAPAALAISKLFYPETLKSKTKADSADNIMSKGDSKNVLEAASRGALDSITMVATIIVNLIAFTALLQLINNILSWFGERIGMVPPEYESITFQFLCSYLFYPVVVMMGVIPSDARKVASLIGVKTFLNEFIAYKNLESYIKNVDLYSNITTQFANQSMSGPPIYYQGQDLIVTTTDQTNVTLVGGLLQNRSIVISTYALCGFSNVASIGCSLAVMQNLAPKRTRAFTKIVVRAMIAGNIACFLTACVAGLYFISYKFSTDILSK